ncbi:MAG: tryptophan synthase subunit alpha [Betaproteobacteria bacterium]|nr:tryptophan synthase subunit alpha [Betaproteobacteria bacterium]NBT74914.1 tryptophan synthase subunit alpha [Betaproteobacteria bacterium]NBY13212.1 tryptophan synthase subunit alpha [Betaproteobacteria bacterium]
MSRLAARFAELSAQGRKALIPYITAGDPSREQTPELLRTLAQAGADVIELGVPFSDPMADGPVIQRSSERALARGVRLQDCLNWVADFRRTNDHTPMVLMGYANPIERYGQEAFVRAASQAGVDGVLVVDYPPEECETFAASLRAAHIDPIFLLAPTSSDERIDQVARLGGGYLYYVSLTGVTGASTLNAQAVGERVAHIRGYTSLPIGVGFGISDAQSACAVAQEADAVVIGSALIRLMDSHHQQGTPPIAAAEQFVASIRKALDAQFHGVRA